MRDDTAERLDGLESKLDELLRRVERLELRFAPSAAPRPVSEPTPAPGPARTGPTVPTVPRPDLEELLGGRVLGWVGGSAIVLGAVFFLVMAVSRGWIDEPTPVVLAFLRSASVPRRGGLSLLA